MAGFGYPAEPERDARHRLPLFQRRRPMFGHPQTGATVKPNVQDIRIGIRYMAN